MARRSVDSIRIALLFLLPAMVGSAGAAVNRTLDYGLTLELNSDEDDRAFSDLRLSISDDFIARRYSGSYSLNSDFFANHSEGDENDQHRGRFDSDFHILRSTAWWNLDALVEVLPIASEGEIDEFSSQTVSSLETGPTLSLGRRMRGSLDLSALVRELRYTESPLDSTRSDIALTWSYPLDTRSGFGVEARRQSTEYEDSINASSDFDQNSFELFFTTSTLDLTFDASVTASRVESDLQDSDVDSSSIAISYSLNSLSTLVATAEDSLQTAEAFNRLPGNQTVAQLVAGLLRNQRVSIGYRYNYRFFNLSADIFTNQVENVVSDAGDRNQIDGIDIQVSDQFLENYRYSGSFERTENADAGTEAEEIDLSLSYILFHTRSTSSQFGVFVELDDLNGNSSDNSGLRYILNSRIF